jgi:hypothetical protein
VLRAWSSPSTHLLRGVLGPLDPCLEDSDSGVDSQCTRALGRCRRLLLGEALEHGQELPVCLGLAQKELGCLDGVDEIDEEGPKWGLVSRAATWLDLGDPAA